MMAFQSSIRLPGERASKLGHLSVVRSEWVQSIISDFETNKKDDKDTSGTCWLSFDPSDVKPLTSVWATDGSFVTIKATGKPPKEISFVKTALLTIDKARLDNIDKEHPHPLHMQDVMKDSAVFHATVFPLKNVKSSKDNNYHTVRHIINDSMKIDQNGAFYETLKWLAFKKWSNRGQSSPKFSCPHCRNEVDDGIPFNEDSSICPQSSCRKEIFLTDMIGFHLDMDEESAPDSLVSAYMLIMETLMLFTAIRLLWDHVDKNALSETLFIKDGPLTLRSQYSKLVPNIREFLEYSKIINRPIHIIGQEKTGSFCDHLATISRFPKPHTIEDPLHYSVLSHSYVRKEVHRTPGLKNPYGMRTNWGEKTYVKLDPTTELVLSIPTGAYYDDDKFPTNGDIIGLDRILATLPSLISRKFEGALYPVELANGIASMSSYPSSKILQNFAEENFKN